MRLTQGEELALSPLRRLKRRPEPEMSMPTTQTIVLTSISREN